MDIKSTLFVCEHPTEEEPHATAIVDIPLDQVKSNPRLNAIYEEFGAAERQMVNERGSLALSQDYTFDEEYKDGVGLIMEDVKLDVNRLKPDERGQIADWVKQSYDPNLPAGATNQQLSAAVDANREHIKTDMSVSGMSPDFFVNMMQDYQAGKIGADDFPSHDQVKGMADSIQARGGDMSAKGLRAFHDKAMGMRDAWPSSDEKNYGRENPGEGEVIFYKGFQASSEVVMKAGPYAFASAWPANTEGFENGIPRDEDGKIVPIGKVEVDSDYIYHPKAAIQSEFGGKQGEAIVNGLLNSVDAPPPYDGFGNNCVSVSGKAAFGQNYNQIEQSLGVAQGGKVTNAMLLDQMEQGAGFGQGMQSQLVAMNDNQPGAQDHNRLQEAEMQLGGGRAAEMQPTRGAEQAQVAVVAKELGMSGLDAGKLAEIGNIGQLLGGLGVSHRPQQQERPETSRAESQQRNPDMVKQEARQAAASGRDVATGQREGTNTNNKADTGQKVAQR